MLFFIRGRPNCTKWVTLAYICYIHTLCAVRDATCYNTHYSAFNITLFTILTSLQLFQYFIKLTPTRYNNTTIIDVQIIKVNKKYLFINLNKICTCVPLSAPRPAANKLQSLTF